MQWLTVGRLLLEALGCIRGGSAVSCVAMISEALMLARQLEAARIVPPVASLDSLVMADAIDRSQLDDETYFWDENPC